MSRTCPVCFSADEVTQTRSVDGLWTFTCDYTSKHEGRHPYVWDDTNVAAGSDDSTRRALDPLMGPLLACVRRDEPYIEYGIVEWRFRASAPALFADLLTEHGHTRLNPIKTLKTTSAYLAQALGLLAANGQLQRVYGPATGAWNYNGTVTYWAVPPAPPTTSQLSWRDFAISEGLDPADLAQSI